MEAPDCPRGVFSRIDEIREPGECTASGARRQRLGGGRKGCREPFHWLWVRERQAPERPGIVRVQTHIRIGGSEAAEKHPPPTPNSPNPANPKTSKTPNKSPRPHPPQRPPA